MSEAPLTQEEIQALIAGMTGGEQDTDGAALARLEEELAAAYAAVAESLGSALGESVEVGRPAVEKRTVTEVAAAVLEGGPVVYSTFGDGLSGAVALGLSDETAARLGDTVTPTALGDQVFAALASRFATVLGNEVTVTPAVAAAAGSTLAQSGLSENIAQAFTPLTIGGAAAGHWLLLIDEAIALALTGDQAEATAAAAVAALAAAPPAEPADAAPAPAAPAPRPIRAVPPPAAAPAAPAQRAPVAAPAAPAQPIPVQPAAFGDIGRPTDTGDLHNIDLLLDVPLQVTVELGRTKRPIKDVLALGPGSVLELDKLAGEPVDVLVNGQLVARGEVVVIDENFGVRITDIISPVDRVRSL